MRLLTVIGLLVILMMLANSNILHGSMCAGSLGCVGANNTGIRIHEAP